ncbi:serine/threonine-protein kinase [Mycobacterium asiaticum]|uniref:non-specific serine/threonine protein kinase n=1 Tax=Mycobacterium asiaticum TaxID=1790 RepID=A0A1A3NDW9_MYCAS|nr:serine/threonine-protein kinase [Mycobacterium asiaticum]OBK19279.1 protein kinase [Mycobacterium asiaticum]
MTSPHRGLRLGTRFGPYELRSLIGAGGMGEVYRALDTTKDRMVALKLLRAELAADPVFQERFRRECQLAARLQEPHVIPVHDFGQIDGVLFIDMRLVEGGTLKDLIATRGALDPAQTAAIIAQVAAALDAAHADGLVHRDVKPENILLTAEHFAYLTDFGIARTAGASNVTASGWLVGSCAYMAPERFSDGWVGPQTDVYSLTCVLYECLTGQPPFEQPEIQQLISSHMFSVPPRPSIMRRGIDRAFDRIVAEGMAKQPATRFATAGELAMAVRAAAGSGLAPAPARASGPARASAPAGGTAAPPPPSRTRAFPVSYENPNDTGYSPYLPSPFQPSAQPDERRARGLGRVPMLLGAIAAVMLVVAAILAGVLILGNRSTDDAAAPSPSSPTPKTPALSQPVDGADGLGFIGHPARCDPGHPPAAVLRTAQSLAVICQSGPNSFYYRGERIRDGANIELANAVRSGDGFDVTNPANGVRYEVRPQRLTIRSGGHVDSAEPVLQYAVAK